MDSTSKDKVDGKKRVRPTDSYDPGNSSISSSSKKPKPEGDTCTPLENVNEIRSGLQHEKHSTGKSHIQPSEGVVNTNSNAIATYLRSTPKKLDYPLKSDIHINLVVKNGEYNLKLTSVPTDNKMTKHAHNAAMLLSQGELLCKLGQKLLSELREHNESETYRTLNL
ncbi:hypothetical protein TSUD_161550 [Trifolium subterraneum]|uniref:Uncharacterized protein n=1 Tax=Trifolium subterraneum TaxID=3900 RepID=A0A2Z6N787_TRISU|nr:hypothetical protein TSUD_161550 [Trifolium subterraneum]